MSQPEATNLCPVCQHANPAGKERCEICGAELSSLSTIPVSETIRGQVVEAAQKQVVAEQVSAEYTGTLALYVAGEGQPITIQPKDEIVLGRNVVGELPVTVDFTAYHAHLLGVSRRHARISCENDRYLVEDLNSSNGSWLNENPLVANQPQPLKSGDQLRLGQLIIFVYFLPFHSIFLKDETNLPVSSSRGKITPDYIAAYLIPYLGALTSLQTILDTLRGQKIPEIGIHSITITADNVLHINLSGGKDAAQLIKDQVGPWRAKYAKSIAEFNLKEKTTNSVPSPLPEDPAEAAVAHTRMVSFFAWEVINQVKPEEPDDKKRTVVEQLIIPLQTLIFGPMEMTNPK